MRVYCNEYKCSYSLLKVKKPTYMRVFTQAVHMKGKVENIYRQSMSKEREVIQNIEYSRDNFYGISLNFAVSFQNLSKLYDVDSNQIILSNKTMFKSCNKCKRVLEKEILSLVIKQ